MNDLIRRLTMRHLRLLVTLYDMGGVSRTARLLHVTQPAVSKTVRDLRDIIGDVLFEATGDGLHWTPAGQVVVQRARAILRNVDDLERETQRAKLGTRDRFAIGTTRVAEAAVSATLPAALLKEGLQVSLQRGTREQMLAELERKALDIVFGRCDAGFRRAEFDYHPIYRDRFVVVCGRGHPWWRRRSVTLAALATQEWILPPPGTFASHVFEQAFLSENLTPPQASVLSTLGLNDLPMLASHPLLALFPESEAQRLQADNQVRCIDGLRTPYQEVGAILLRDTPPLAVHRRVIRLMGEFATGRLPKMTRAGSSRDVPLPP